MIKKFRTVFILGGPGSGKGTQSQLIEKSFKFKHLSAGQLLRKEQARAGSEFKAKIQKVILDGNIVPSFITTDLLLSAMRANEATHRRFLIDGFPRNMENYTYWKDATKDLVSCPFVLHFKCSESQMVKRLLKRANQGGRTDDKVEVISKRLKTYYNQTGQVLKEFEKSTQVHHIEADESAQKIFKKVSAIFEQFLRKNNED